MAEVINDIQEEEVIRKLNAKRRVRGLLIAINFILLGYLIFCITASIVDLVRSSKNIDGIVALTDKNQKDSLEIYKKYVNDDNAIGGDFVIYGDKIAFTEKNFTKDDPTYYQDIQLLKIETNRQDIVKDEALHYENIDNLNAISLFETNSAKTSTPTQLECGDYLFCVNAKSVEDLGKIIKIDNGKDMEYTLYSLPNEKGQRVKATVYAYSKNPALVLNIDYVSNLPENYLDVAIVGSLENYNKIKDNFNNLKVAHYDKITNEELYKLNTHIVVKLFNSIDSDKTVVQTNPMYHDDYAYDNYADENILSLAGYATSSGYQANFMSEHYPGKMVYLVSFPKQA